MLEHASGHLVVTNDRAVALALLDAGARVMKSNRFYVLTDTDSEDSSSSSSHSELNKDKRGRRCRRRNRQRTRCRKEAGNEVVDNQVQIDRFEVIETTGNEAGIRCCRRRRGGQR